jgi:hypothetical protein
MCGRVTMAGFANGTSPAPTAAAPAISKTDYISAALEYALEREAAIVPQVSWTDSPARDIVRLASETHAAWILLGFHRPVLGANLGRGRESSERVRRMGALASGSLFFHRHAPWRSSWTPLVRSLL